MQPILSGGAKGAEAVKNVTTESFMTEVIDASHDGPVVVDFWATWCGPCKTLGPMLEKAVRETKGAVRMVKMDVDKHPEIPAQLRVQSIPAVYAFKDGRPVDGFVGAVPESQIKAFVKRLVELAKDTKQSPVDAALEEANAALAEGDFGTAGTFFNHILQHEPDNAVALAGLGRCHIGLDQVEAARALVDGLSAAQMKAPELIALRTAVDLAEQALKAGPVRELEQRLAADPNDHQTRFDLAMAHFAKGEREAAVDHLLDLVKRDRAWNDEAGRKQLVKFFEAFGPADPLTLASRRRLSTILFS